MKDVEWMDDAACEPNNTHLFHSDLASQRAQAKKICASCPVQTQCAMWSLDQPWLPHVVVGGLTGRGRAAVRRGYVHLVP